MVDNLKSAVLQRLAGVAPLFNPRYVDFARHYGFTIAPCNVARANEKGRVESEVGYNTAGASDTLAAEALSGLARAFFYAGARALLVSYVDSDGAVKLATRAITELQRNPNIGRAEALRRAMLALMADTSRPPNWTPVAHPAVWAPFVVVGEGGN
jgi:hypothetical protein